MMPADALDRLRPFDAIFFGAVGDPRLQDNVTLNGLLLPIRRGFDQYACVRPAVLYPGVRVPARRPAAGGHRLRRSCARTPKASTRRSAACCTPDGPHEVAMQSAMFTRHGTERVIRFAFDLARRRNAQAAADVGHEVERAGLQHGRSGIASSPRSRASIRTSAPSRCSSTPPAWIWSAGRRTSTSSSASNLFGDILTDLSAAITGSLGLAPSANLNPPRTFPSMFEPVHGSAPDIAGRGIANPMATMLAGAMMLDFLGQPAAAQAIESAVRHVLAGQNALTPDLGGTGTTETVTGAVLDQLDKNQKVYAGKGAT